MNRIDFMDMIMARWRMAAVLLLTSVLALTDTAYANQFKRIRDVNVSCNNALSCDLYITNPRVTLHTFGFRRRASNDADVDIFLGTRDPLQAGSELQFSVDNQLILSIPVAALSYRAAVYEYSYGVQEDVAALLNATRRGEKIEINYTTKAGRSTAPLSLSGITAGFIFADDVQGRIGRLDALMALTEPPVEEPAADSGSDSGEASLKNWSDLPNDLKAYFGTENSRCSNLPQSGSDDFLGGDEKRLDESTTLIALPCGDPGAYNFPIAYWLKRGDIYLPIAVPVMGDGGPTTMDIVWNASFDEGTKILTSFFKGRGLGDCGIAYEWRLNRDNRGYAFVLTSQKQKDACDGVYEENLSDYRQIWPVP